MFLLPCPPPPLTQSPSPPTKTGFAKTMMLVIHKQSSLQLDRFGILHTSKFLVIICRVTWKTASKMVGTSLAMRSFSLLMMAANRLNTSASLHMCNRKNVKQTRHLCITADMHQEECQTDSTLLHPCRHAPEKMSEEAVSAGMLQDECCRSSVRGSCPSRNVYATMT